MPMTTTCSHHQVTAAQHTQMLALQHLRSILFCIHCKIVYWRVCTDRLSCYLQCGFFPPGSSVHGTMPWPSTILPSGVTWVVLPCRPWTWRWPSAATHISGMRAWYWHWSRSGVWRTDPCCLDMLPCSWRISTQHRIFSWHPAILRLP